MSILRYELCLSDILQGGTLCKNPTIRWEGLGEVEISCPFNDNCKCVEIQVPENAPSKCFNVIIDCEDCDKCPSQVITRCLCDSTEDCGPCEICIDGVCTSRCPEKVCDEDRDICVDCKTSEDCPEDKICVGGKCVCPPDKPYLQPDGRCTACIDDGNCPPCTRCVDGSCVPIDCGTGVCDPNKNDCVGCVNSGDCTGVNQCCINGNCECCDGYEYNPNTGTCDPIGDCQTDNDCPECFICIGDECVPRVCPTGYTCIDDECKKVCDCNEGPCSKTEACIPYNGEICYCEPCGDTCANGENCGYGCYCDNGACKPNPCNAVSCATSLDCGDGCGCYDGVCIPCTSLNCTTDECAQVEGCKCFGEKCKTDPCSGPCENGADCGDGCGCIDGVCVSCDTKSCVGLDCAQTLGCECIGNNCVDKQGCEGTCSVSSDCPVGCTCYHGECVPCEDFPCDECLKHDGCVCESTICTGDSSDPCDGPDLTVLKKDRCELEGSLALEQCCVCEDIDYIVSQVKATVSGATTVTHTLGLYKNGVKLSELPVDNEDEYVGQYKLTVTFGNMQPIVKYVNITQGTTNKDTVVFPAITVPNGSYNYTAKLEISNSLEFESNCVINKRNIAEFYKTNSAEQHGVLFSDSCRNPVFTWYKSSSTSFTNSDIFRQEYISSSDGINYKDVLTADDGLVSGKYYQLEVDCSCSKNKAYTSCKNPGKLYFCNPSIFNYSMSDCNRKVTFGQVTECVTNALGNVTWEMLIKTVAVPTYTSYNTFTASIPAGPPYAAEAVLIPGGTTVTTTSPITDIKFRIVGDPCEECDVEYTHENDPACCASAPTLGLALDCPNKGFTATALDSGTNPIQGCVINVYDSEAATTLVASRITDVSGVASFSNLTTDATYWVDFANGAGTCDTFNCVDIQSITVECTDCVTKSVTANYNPGTQMLNIVLSSVSGGNTYSYKVDGVAFTPNPSVLALSNGPHTATVIETFPDSSQCEYNGVFLVDNCVSTIISVTKTWDQPTQELQVSAISGGTANYTVSFGGQTFTDITAGGVNISTVGMSEGSYPLIVTDANGCQTTVNVLIDNCSSFEGNAVVDCEGGTIDLIFNNGTGPYNYSLKDDENNVIAAGTTASTTVNVVIDPNTVSGDYTLTVTDSLGCVDVDVFPVNCPCYPAPEFDVTRVQSILTAPGEWDININIGNFTNMVFPISITLYEELCEDTPATPFVVINDVYEEADLNVSDEIEMTTFGIVSPPDPTQVAMVITDANGCTACRNVTLVA